MSTNCETKIEYDFLFAELQAFLDRKQTSVDLGIDCINAMRSLLLNLRTKENKLAGYHRTFIKNSKDAKTTSPVEGHNRQIKKGPSYVNNNMHMDKMISRFIAGISARYARRQKAANRELAQKNQSSLAPTRDYVIVKGQALIDTNYDARTEMKYARIGASSFWVWNFEPQVDPDRVHPIMHYLPEILRLRQLKVTRDASDASARWYVNCSCGERTTKGVPCTCFFKLADEAGICENEIIDLNMLDITYSKLFNAEYGKETENASLLIRAQKVNVFKFIHSGQNRTLSNLTHYFYIFGYCTLISKECFDTERKGISVTESFAKKLCTFDSETDNITINNPILGVNTSDQDFAEAKYVYHCLQSGKCCSRRHLTEVDINSISVSNGKPTSSINKNRSGEGLLTSSDLTNSNKRLQGLISQSIEEMDNEQLNVTRYTDEESTDFRKDILTIIDQSRSDSRASAADLNEFRSYIQEGYKELQMKLSTRWGEVGGGEGKLVFGGCTQDRDKVLSRFRGSF